MREKQVSYAKHNTFYKILFNKHKEILENLIEVNLFTLQGGYKNLLVFYSAYSYYLKDEVIDYKLEILEKKKELEDNIRYNKLTTKINLKSVEGLSYPEFIEVNDIYFDELKSILSILEVFCNKLPLDDLMPNITESSSDYEKNVLFASYEVFYECLYSIHSKIYDKLLAFNLKEFREMLKVIMTFFYGYSYYISNQARKSLVLEFKDLFKEYNNREFISLYFKLINNNITPIEAEKLTKQKDKIFNDSLSLFEKINDELPKKNLMPRKTEKVLVDMTLM